jgi:hypothetical protein
MALASALKTVAAGVEMVFGSAAAISAAFGFTDRCACRRGGPRLWRGGGGAPGQVWWSPGPRRLRTPQWIGRRTASFHARQLSASPLATAMQLLEQRQQSIPQLASAPRSSPF